MALAYLKNRLSLEEYLELRKKQDKGTGRLTSGAITNAQLFCQDQFNLEFITVLGEMREEILSTNQLDVCMIFFQKFVSWMAKPHLELKMKPNAVHKNGAPCRAKDLDTIRGYVIQIRLIMKKVGGIPISSEDVKDYNLSYPAPTEKEEAEPLTHEEFRLICDNQRSFRRQMLYRIKKDTEARIGAMVQLRKKHFNTKVRPIAITFPKSIVKKKNGISFTNVKYVIKEDEGGILKLLEMFGDDDLVFGNNQDKEQARNNEEKVWSDLVQKLGFTARFPHSGKLKKNIHSIKAFTFTAARKAVDLDYANAYGDHAAYTKNYLRLSDEEKTEMFKKLEPFITIYTKTEIVETLPEVATENTFLKSKIRKIEEELASISSAQKGTSKLKLTPEKEEKLVKFLQDNNLF